jgi:FeS assembly protein IscX
MTWDDADEIGLELSDKYRDMDPLTVSFTDLQRMVTELEDFDDDPLVRDEGKLERIQQKWLEGFAALQE